MSQRAKKKRTPILSTLTGACFLAPFIAALALTLFPFPTVTFADDAAASVPAGGIQLRQELRISMERERLTIGEKKVTVEYEFLNLTDQDITTEVAFPAPAFGVFDTDCGPRSTFDDFRVWIDRKEMKYEIEDRALVAGTNYTEVLHKLKIEVGSFGAYWGPPGKCDGSSTFQVNPLSPEQKSELVRLGLIDKDDVPRWTVVRIFHWPETFPAHRAIHVRHEYTPVAGYQYVSLADLDPAANEQKIAEAERKTKEDPSGPSFLDMLRPIHDACLDPSLLKTLKTDMHNAYSPEAAKKYLDGPLIDTFWEGVQYSVRG